MPSPVTRPQFDAVLFDLDGVLPTTLAVHAAAWKRTLDEFLRTWDARHGTTSSPFDERTDYATYVDGKPRQDGVRAFLTARGIELPEGTPGSEPEEESVWATAPPSWRTRASRTCSTPGWTARRRWSCTWPASRRPTPSWRQPGGSASHRHAPWWSRTSSPAWRPDGRAPSVWWSA